MRTVVFALVALGLLQAGCAARAAARAQPAQTTVILLSDDDGTTGAARVSTPAGAGAVDLDGALEATDVARGQAPAPARVASDTEVQRLFGDAFAALPLAPVRVVLRFEFDSDELTAASRAELPALITQIRGRPAPEVIVVGHTDTVGNPDGNIALGLRRAEAVRRILIDAGVSADLIEVRSHGEADPLVTTADETPEPANRRVELTLR